MESQMQAQPSLYAATAPYTHHIQQQQQPASLQGFWSIRRYEIDKVDDFKNHQLPLARIKKIMKADEDVRMISAEAPVLFAKACELFILELTLRSWLHAEENKRRTLQRNDIAAAITRTDIFDFLVDIVPKEEIKEEPPTAAVTGENVAAGVPYNFYSQAGAVGPGVMMGRPAMESVAAMYMHRGVMGQGGMSAGVGWPQMWHHGGLIEDESYSQSTSAGMEGQGY